MKIKNLISNIGAAFIVALSLVGCSDYDNGYTEEQLKFIQGFKDVFGEIDHSNDWNLAERGSVTVTTSKPSRIKIYANYAGTYKIVGDYEDVLGTRTLAFDMVEGTTDLMVSNGQSAQKVKVGGCVTFSGTRYTGFDISKNSNGDDIISVGDEFAEIDGDKYVKIITDADGDLPEGGQDNGKNVTDNFVYVSQGPFTFYPVFIFSSSSHRLGIYWKDENDKYQTQYVYWDNSIYKTKEWYSSDNENDEVNRGEATVAKTYYAKPITINLDEGTEFGFFLETYGAWDGSEETYDDEGYTHWDNHDDSKIKYCVYSEESMNLRQLGQPLDERIIQPDENGNLNNAATKINVGYTSWAGTITKEIGNEVIQYLCFEDWHSSDHDYNDLIFIMKGELPVALDEDAASWVLSCEDLGGSFDLDYNDVVVEFNYVSGRNEVNITPLAAGGTLASFMYFYDGINPEPRKLGEIHSYFGQGETTSGNYKPVNVTVGKKYPDQEITKVIPPIKVSENWSLSSFDTKTNADNQKAFNAEQRMGGFFIKVLEQGSDYYRPDDDANLLRIQNQDTYTSENYPYIICTPRTWERQIEGEEGVKLKGVYRWPQENVSMYPYNGFAGAAYNFSDKYSFRSWVTGAYPTESVDWYKYPDIESTCSFALPRRVNGISGADYEEVDGSIIYTKFKEENIKYVGNLWNTYDVNLYTIDIPEGYGVIGSKIYIVNSLSGMHIAIYEDDEFTKQIGSTIYRSADPIVLDRECTRVYVADFKAGDGSNITRIQITKPTE